MVAGVNIDAVGGCAAGRVLTNLVFAFEAPAGVALCPVPNDCDDARVQNATATMTEAVLQLLDAGEPFFLVKTGETVLHTAARAGQVRRHFLEELHLCLVVCPAA